MASPAENTPKKEEKISRFEAQLNFGLFARWDYTMIALLVATWVVIGFYWAFRPEPSITSIIIGFLFSILAALLWLIVLVYRVLVWILDIRADINLLPEAAARIVIGFQEGRSK